MTKDERRLLAALKERHGSKPWHWAPCASGQLSTDQIAVKVRDAVVMAYFEATRKSPTEIGRDLRLHQQYIWSVLTRQGWKRHHVHNFLSKSASAESARPGTTDDGSCPPAFHQRAS